MEYPVYTAKLLLSTASSILQAVGKEYGIDLVSDATENVEDALEILDRINTQGVNNFIQEIQAIDDEDIDWDNLPPDDSSWIQFISPLKSWLTQIIN